MHTIFIGGGTRLQHTIFSGFTIKITSTCYALLDSKMFSYHIEVFVPSHGALVETWSHESLTKADCSTRST